MLQQAQRNAGMTGLDTYFGAAFWRFGPDRLCILPVVAYFASVQLNVKEPYHEFPHPV